MMTEDNDETDTNKASKSGSETRQSSCLVGVRFHPDKHAKLVEDADKVELTPAAYLRWCYDSTPPPRQSRRPSVDKQEVARLVGELGKVGSNLNQIAKHLNQGHGVGSNSIAEAIADVRAMRDACLAALGRKP